MSVSSSSTLKDDSSTTSSASSHTAQPSDPSDHSPSPTQPFLNASEEASPDPMLLTDQSDSEVDSSSGAFNGAASEPTQEANGSGNEPEEQEKLMHEEADEADISESGEDDVEECEIERGQDIQEAEDAYVDDHDHDHDDGEEKESQFDDNEVSTVSDHESYDEDDIDEEPTDIFAFASSFTMQASGTTQQDKDAWRKFYPNDPSDDSADEDMNLERIEDILFLAECRLRDQEKALQRLTPSTTDIPAGNSTGSNFHLPTPYVRSSDKIVRPDPRALVDPNMRALADKPCVISELISVKRTENKKAPVGLSTHFNIPRTNVTPELKRDLQLLSMRAVLDPKRMYKRQGKFKIPEYSQVGTIVEGPTDFFGGRINKRDRQRSFVSETMQAEKQSGRFKRKYEELQSKKRSGKRGSYKAKMAKRRRV